MRFFHLYSSSRNETLQYHQSWANRVFRHQRQVWARNSYMNKMLKTHNIAALIARDTHKRNLMKLCSFSNRFRCQGLFMPRRPSYFARGSLDVRVWASQVISHGRHMLAQEALAVRPGLQMQIANDAPLRLKREPWSPTILLRHSERRQARPRKNMRHSLRQSGQRAIAAQ